MCGLFGVASTEGRKYENDRRNAFEQGLKAAEWRGEDASGIAVVPIKDLDKPAIVFKKAMPASDLVRMEQYKRIMFNLDQYAYVLGHARSSTSDRSVFADSNAHPFQYGPITLVHNGHIQNANSIGSSILHTVDSAHVAGALAVRDAKSVLESLVGGFALVWHDARDKSLNFARNMQRPLIWAYVEKENTMFWGSELEAMWAVLNRNGIKMDGKFKWGSPLKHFKFVHDDLRGFKVTPFAQAATPKTVVRGHGQQPSAPWTGETRRLAETPGMTESTTKIGGKTPSADTGTTKIEPTQIYVYEPPSTSSRPKINRKIRSVEKELQDFGLKMDQAMMFVPEVFRMYKNHRGMIGAIEGHDRVRGRPFVIENVRKSVWDKANACGKIYGRVVNIRRRGKEAIFVCDYDKNGSERFAFRHLSAVGGADKDRPFHLEQQEDDLTDKEVYCGPGGQKISKEEFIRRTKEGCAWCSSDIDIDDHDRVRWVGQNDEPLGKCCSYDPTVLREIGIRGDSIL